MDRGRNAADRHRPLEFLTNRDRRAADLPAGGAVVGRDVELAELEALLDGASTGRGGLVLVTGEPGIGKTRLLDETAQRAAGRGLTVVRARCWEGGGAPALWPWTQLLRALRSQPDLPTAVDDAVASLLARIQPGSPGPEDPGRFELLDALVSALAGPAQLGGSLVITVDDLHGADTASLTALVLLADRLPDLPVALIAAARDVDARSSPEVARHLATLARRGARLGLRGLDDPAVGRFILDRTGVAASPELTATMSTSTGGNPFFLDQVLRLVPPISGRAPAAIPVPDQVREAIRWRLAPLSRDVVEVLATASVTGREFEPGVVAALLGRPVDEVVTALAAAEEHGLVATDRWGDRTEFVHSLVRETLYEDLPVSARKRLHLAVAELCDRRTDATAAVTAHHRLAALPLGDRDAAMRAAREAAARAGSVSAFDTAVELRLRVVELLEEDEAAQTERCAARLEFGEAQRLSGDIAGARTTFLEAAELATTPEQLATAALGYAAGMGGHGFVDRADESVVALLERAIEEVGDGASALRVRLLARLAIELYYTPSEARRESLSREALELAERVGDERALVVARYSLAWSGLGPDDLETRRLLADDVAARALRLGDLEMALRGYHLRFTAALEAGDTVEADQSLDRYGRLVEEVRQPLYRWHLELLRGMRAFLSGDLERAERHAFAALDLGLPIQGDTAALLFGVQLCSIRWAQGRIGEVEPAIRVFVEQYPWSAWRPALVLATAEAGRLEETRALLEPIAADSFGRLPRDGNWLTTLCHLALPCAVLGDRERCGVLYDLLEPYADRTVVANAGAVCYGSVSSFLGLLAATLGRPDDAERHYEAGLVHDLAVGHRVMATWTLLHYGELLREVGDDARAEAVLADATRRAEELGLATLSARARSTVAAAEAPPVTARDPAVFRREGDYWTVAFAGEVCRLRDGKGPRYLAQLLANPGQRIPAIDLVVGGGDRLAPAGHEPELSVGGTGGAGPALDAQAKAAYRQRLRDLDEDREEATAFNDVERVAAIDAEVEALLAELSRAVGIGGRDRPTASPVERARVSVTKLLKQTIRRIAGDHEALGRHLAATVRTGTFCVYDPDPASVTVWET